MSNKKYNVNDSFFNNQNNWGENQAYILGWVLSDGHISKKLNSISLKLALSDKKILETIKKEMNYTGPLRIEKRLSTNLQNCKIQDRSCLTIYSKEIKSALNKLGYNNQKGANMNFPKFSNKKLINHFVRGYFDGDGCVSFSCVKGRLLAEINLIGTKEFCECLIKILNKENLNPRLGAKFKNNCMYIRLSGNLNVLKLFNFMYKDATLIFKRKFKKFLRILNFGRKRNSLRAKDKENIINKSCEIALQNIKLGNFS